MKKCRALWLMAVAGAMMLGHSLAHAETPADYLTRMSDAAVQPVGVASNLPGCLNGLPAACTREVGHLNIVLVKSLDWMNANPPPSCLTASTGMFKRAVTMMIDATEQVMGGIATLNAATMNQGSQATIKANGIMLEATPQLKRDYLTCG